MLASSFLDPVLGLDVHFEMVPTPAPVPTPIPNPFIGIVFDPIGLACGIALGAAIGAVTGAPFQGPVLYWTAFPATNTGTEAKAVPGHILIPPGVAWAPFPKTPKPVIHPGETPKPALPIKPEDDAVVIFGSKTVTVMGSNAVRLGDIALSCSEPLRLPSSVVLAVPKGAPILIGGPPSLDIMAAIMASLRTRFVSDSLHALLSRLKPSRFRNFLHRVVCFFTGHPVDVASGKVMTEFVDAELPGPLPLRVERIYSSAFASRKGPLGHGWSSSLDQAIWRERGKVVLLAEDGREIEFDTFEFEDHHIRAGESVHHPIERLTLHCDPGGAWRVVGRHGDVREFASPSGRADGRAMIQRIRSSCGFHEIRFHYDERGRLAWVRDSCKRTLGLRYDAHDRVAELLLPKPEGEGHDVHRRYVYDDEGDLVAVDDALAGRWSFAYVGHLLAQERDRCGHSYYFAYDGVGEDAWCVRTWGDDGVHDHVLAYDKQNHVTFVTNSRGYTTQYHANAIGQIVKIVDARGGETHFEYDPVTLQQVAKTDPLGRRHAFELDARGNTVRETRPDGSTLEMRYDERNRLVAAVDMLGGEWSWHYDGHGRLLERRACDGSRIGYRYQGGYATTVMRGDGRTTRVGYDARGQLDAIQRPDGTFVRWTFDGLGRATRVVDPRNLVRRRELDLLGRPRRVWLANGDLRALDYDAEGRLLHAKDTSLDVALRWSGSGRLLARTQAGTTLHFEYDTENLPTAVVDEHGHAHRFEFDERGEVRAETGFDARTRIYERDAAGQVVGVLRASGRRDALRYDPAGRVVDIEYGGGGFVRYAYRADGKLVGAENQWTKLAFERDSLGRLVCERQGDHWIRSARDARGLRSRVWTSFGLVQDVERDLAGDVVGVQAREHQLGEHDEPDRLAAGSLRWAAEFKRDATGLELERVLPGGVRSLWERNAFGRPTAHRVEVGGAAVRDVRHAWNQAGRLAGTSDVLHELESRHGHDPLGQLAWVAHGDGHVDLRMPDAVGNLFGRSDRSDRRYGPGGELLEAATPAGVRVRRYDDDGNLVARVEPDGATWHYEWSGSGMLTKVTRPDGEVVEFEYDPLGRRTLKRAGGETTRWVWDVEHPLHEWTEGREAAAISWVFEPGTFTPMAKLSRTDSWSIVSDYLGTPVMMLDEGGREVWSAKLDAYGRTRGSVANDESTRRACPFRWPGQYDDVETGLHYNRFRYYDPDAGQYISQDPLGLAAGLSAYGYVDDPLVRFDPLGLVPLDADGYSVYHITDGDGKVVYVGITDDPARRQLEHQRSGRLTDDYNFNTVADDLTYAEARGYEQADIRHYETRDTSRIGKDIEAGEPNRCWSYDPARVGDPSDVRAQAFAEHERARTEQHGGCK